ncbi:MAG: 1-deoxy-D-xylulose-5-phosphate synthase [Acidaminobacteraceae bacterium]
MKKILDNIDLPCGIKNLNNTELIRLSVEIRQFLLEKLSATGGHLASNLGVVELTIALHKTYNSPSDKIIWDVGHQGYVHKILTGRCENFDSLRQMNGMSGFLKRCESEHDIFEAGHSSTSISAGIGLAKSRDILNDNYNVVSVIGDGALTGGMAFEALNNLGDSKEKMTIILNDNDMSIDENIGGLVSYLGNIRTTSTYHKIKSDTEHLISEIPKIGPSIASGIRKIKGSIKYIVVPGMLFEDLGLTYIGPVDGHKIDEMTDAFQRAKKINGPTIVHVITKKGKGYRFAEENPDQYHGVSAFDIKKRLKSNNKSSFSKVFGDSLIEIATTRKNIVAITAAMPTGTGLAEFKKKFPKRLIDVGIAEQHGVTLAAGMSVGGIIPVVAVYSTFLQRAYDQILHDVCIQNLHVVFAIDRAGIVGNDGETHHGVFDISYLSHIPNITLLAPETGNDLDAMLKYSVNDHNAPIAIRYPRAGASVDRKNQTLFTYESLAKPEIIASGKDVLILAIGNMVEKSREVAQILEKEGIDVTLAKVKMIKPLLKEYYEELLKDAKLVVTIEDHSIHGGFGDNISNFINNELKMDNIKIRNLGFPDKFIEHGSIPSIQDKYELTPIALSAKIKTYL